MADESADFPPVTFADTISDQQWFADHPHRQYRVRLGWVVRRHGGNVYSRTPLNSARRYADDDDRLAERAWWETAYPTMAPDMRNKLAKKARWKKSIGQRKPRPSA